MFFSSIKHILKIGLILATLAAAQPAQAAEYLCRPASLADGLSQSDVSALARDNRGFVWIGTRFGLNRYDFEKMVNYYHDPSDERTIPDNSITTLFADSHGHLWVAGEEGLARHHANSNDFERIRIDGREVNVRSFCEEATGLLMGGAGQIFFYDYASGAFARLLTKGGSSVYYTGIHLWMPGYYILTTRWDGLWLYDRNRASITRLPGVPEKYIMATCVDSRGKLWVSPYGQGVFVYDRAGKRSEPITQANSKLPSDVVLDMADHDGRIWMATEGAGIALYDPTDGTFSEGDPHRGLGQLGSVKKLYVDRHGNMFAGTVHDGAVAVCPVAARTFHTSALGDRLIAVKRTLQSPDGSIWIGDDGGGVLRMRPGSENFEHIPSTARMKVTDIIMMDEHTLLITTFIGGFHLLDTRTNALRSAPKVLMDFYERNMTRAMPTHLARLTDDIIAIVDDRIALYNTNTGVLDTTAVKSSRENTVGQLVPFYSNGGRMLCTGQDFVSEFNYLTGEHRILTHAPHGEHFYTGAFDGKNRIYLGTDHGTMRYCLDLDSLDTVEGMEPLRVSAVALDNNGRLWMAANNALYFKDVNGGSIASLGSADGVAANEYMPTAVLPLADRLYLGGVNGLLRVNLDEVESIVDTRSDPVISLADVVVDGTSAYGRMQEGILEIPHDHTTVVLSIIDNGYGNLRRQHFRYYIRSSSGERQIESVGRTIALNFLEQGRDYEVLTACSRPDGTWSRPQKLMNLAVMAPWWRSGWSLGVSVALGVLLLAWWEYSRSRSHRRKAEARIDAYRSSTLENEVAFWVNANYALRTPLTLIYAPVKVILERLNAGENVDNIMPELEGVYRNTKKMRDAIDMALELHHVGSAMENNAPGTHDISRSIEDVIAAHSHDTSLKDITVSYHPAEDMFPAIYDRDRLATVIDTLLMNAVQRSAEHSAVTIRAFRNGEYVRVVITDTGESLDEATVENLFSKYFNDDNSNFGNALVFAYAKSIIDMLGGRIGAENNAAGTGLTVWFEFPAADTPAAEAYTKRRRHNEPAPSAQAPETLMSDIDTSELTAIVVEEDNDLCMFIAHQLSMHFRKVLHAFNGKDALILIKQNQPDIVISSVMLPFRSGIELCHAIKSSPDTSHIPVILLTAIKEGAESGYGAGADSYLLKPFDINMLLTRCRNLLHTRSVIKKRYSEQSVNEVAKRQMPNADETFLMKIDKIIAENIERPEFNVETVVSMMNSSRSALYTKFKDITGVTIGSYIADYKLRRAKEMLRRPGMTVSEISEALGFSSQRYFSTFFKERTGMSPSAFRAAPDADKPANNQANE